MEKANSIGLAYPHAIQRQINMFSIIKEIGGVVCPMALAFIRRLMVICIQASSKMDLNTDKGPRCMEMEITIKASLSMVCQKAMEIIPGKTVVPSREISNKDLSMDTAFGRRTKIGLNHIKDITLWIKNQAMVSILGIMDGVIKAIFKKTSAMATESSMKAITN
jgi:hypothetical protein